MSDVTGYASLIGSLSLVLVTAWYAYQTQRVARETREGRKTSVRPVVRLDRYLSGVAVMVQVENVGTGPALDLSIQLDSESDNEALRQTAQWSASILRPGESRKLYFPMGADGRKMTFTQLEETHSVIRLTGTCDDIDGRPYEVADELQFGEDPHAESEVRVVRPHHDWTITLEAIADELQRIRRHLDSNS